MDQAIHVFVRVPLPCHKEMRETYLCIKLLSDPLEVGKLIIIVGLDWVRQICQWLQEIGGISISFQTKVLRDYGIAA